MAFPSRLVGAARFAVLGAVTLATTNCGSGSSTGAQPPTQGSADAAVPDGGQMDVVSDARIDGSAPDSTIPPDDCNPVPPPEALRKVGTYGGTTVLPGGRTLTPAGVH